MPKKSLFDLRRHDGQMDMPGTNPAIQVNRRLQPSKPQLPCDIGLFSDEADQLDLVSWFTEQSEE
jgi:hypothetical protein